MQSDAELLAEYVDRQSEAAFTQLVERHVALVHSAALRQVGEPHLAQEITQAVFIILARKARSLVGHAVLAGWLCRTAHLAALDALKQQRRRQQREHNAYLESAMNEISADTEAAWQQLAPVLDEAVAQLRDHDRAALILRYYEQRPMEEVGAALGVGPDAAQKRVTRALEKLRQLFAKRGVKVTVAVIVAAISAHAVQAVPASLAGSVSAAVLASGSAAAGASTLTLVKGTLTAMAWGQYKALIGYGAAALAVGTAVIVTTLPPKPTTPPASSAVRTNQVAVIREPLTDSMKFMLESPPGGLALQPDGKIIVGTTLFGRFVDDTNGSLGFYTRGALRLNADGTLDRTFRCDVTPPGAAPQMAHVDVLPDGRIFLSGLFGTVDGEARPNYALLHPDGTVDESFQPWRGETNAPAPFFLPKIDSPHIWGLTSYQGGAIPAAWLADNSVALVCQSVETTNFPYTVLTAYRLDSSGRWIKPVSNRLSSDIFRPSGLIDTLAHVGFSARVSVDWERNTPAAWRCPWAPSAKSPFVLPRENSPLGSLAFQCFTEPPAAVDAAKVLRALFEEMPIELCRYAVRLPDGGAILAVRDKENTGMTAPGRFMRFDKDWLPDFSFTNEFVFDLGTCPAIKMQADGKFLVAGFGKMNGEDFSGLIRLLPDGQIDRSFHCETVNSREGRVMDMAIQPDGKIVIGGFFSQVDGVEVPHLARLNPDGSLDTSFQTAFLTEEKFYQVYRETRRVVVAKLSKPATVKPSGIVAAAPPETILITLMKMEAKGALIEFTGGTNRQYVLQARDSLGGADWQTLSTNQTSGNGVGSFHDTEASQHPMRFYRIASQ